MLRSRGTLLALAMVFTMAVPTSGESPSPAHPLLTDAPTVVDPGMRPIQCSRPGRQPERGASRIGRRGGRVALGNHSSFELPRNAVEDNVDFTVTAVPSDSVAFDIHPSGTRFREPGVLRIRYRQLGCRVQQRIGDTVVAWRVGDDGEVLAVIPAIHDPDQGVIIVPITHLSRYVVASN
jgi:hypothetical protein